MLIQYLSEADALSLVPNGAAAMISITEPGRTAPLVFPHAWGALLRVQFADAEYDEAMIERLSARGVHFDPSAKGFPDRRNAETIRAFLDGLTEARHIKALYVHCHAGQRRSAAVARYACELLDVHFEDSEKGHNRTVYTLLNNPLQFDRPQARSWASIAREVFGFIKLPRS